MAEEETEDDHGRERLDHHPQDTERGLPVAQLDVARRQNPEELPVAPQLGQIDRLPAAMRTQDKGRRSGSQRGAGGCVGRQEPPSEPGRWKLPAQARAFKVGEARQAVKGPRSSVLLAPHGHSLAGGLRGVTHEASEMTSILAAETTPFGCSRVCLRTRTIDRIIVVWNTQASNGH